MTEIVIEISDDEKEVIYISSDDDDRNTLTDGKREEELSKIFFSSTEESEEERMLTQKPRESVINSFWNPVFFSKQKQNIERSYRKKCFSKFSLKPFKNRNSPFQETQKSSTLQVQNSEIIECIDLTNDIGNISRNVILKENKPIQLISSSISTDNIKKIHSAMIPQEEVNDDMCSSVAKNICERLKKTNCLKNNENNDVLAEKNNNVLKKLETQAVDKDELKIQLTNILKTSVKNETKMAKNQEKNKSDLSQKREHDQVYPITKKRRNFMDIFMDYSGDTLKGNSANGLHQKNLSCRTTRSPFTMESPGNIFQKLYHPKSECFSSREERDSKIIPLSVLLPKPIKYHKCLGALHGAHNVCEFSENLSSLIEAGLEGSELHLNTTLKQIISMTTTKCRPNYRFIKEIFERLSSRFSSVNKIKIYLQALYYIHDLHELPYLLPVWDYLESVYFIDVLDSHKVDLVIKSAVFNIIVSIVEVSIMNLKSTTDVYSIRSTLAYRLVSLEKYFGNIKTFFAWLEDTIKLYCQLKKDGKMDDINHTYSILTCLQKLLSIALIVSKHHSKNINKMVFEFQVVYNRLNTLEEQNLLLETIQCDLVLLLLCENLLDRCTTWADYQNDDDKFTSLKNSPYSMEKIVKYYFQLEIVINPNSWSPCLVDDNSFGKVSQESLERFLHILVYLQRAYIQICQTQNLKLLTRSLNVRSSYARDTMYMQSLNEHINQLEARLTKSFPTIIKLPKIQYLFLMLRMDSLRLS